MAISHAVLYMNDLVPKPEKLQLQYTPERFDKCGGNPPPIVCCLDPSVHAYSFNSQCQPLMEFSCLVIYALVLIDKVRLLVLWRYDSIVRKTIQHIDWMEKAYRQLSRCLTSPFLSLAMLLVEPYLLTLAALYLSILVRLPYPNGSADIGLDSWSFGQIVAVTIWVPLIVKYIYWTVCRSGLLPILIYATSDLGTPLVFFMFFNLFLIFPFNDTL